MKKFEYLILSYSMPSRQIEDDFIEETDELNDNLNYYGEEGWELIQVTSFEQDYMYFLKREKPPIDLLSKQT